ncbi:helix-turn-helix domain-containing protein [Kineococcus sp. SYSU DK002]|uniref:helix-turn-helix domain-containing protein n=1 Tax=Kineococcus sp. SYSU DK002 TaxID=3383123 RepID=UPI003D7D888A
MTYRPPEAYVHGVGAPAVIVPGRVAAWLEQHAGLQRIRIDVRGADPEVDAVLAALRLAALTWRGTACGTTQGNTEEQAPLSADMSTSTAAARLGITERGVRLAITRGRLTAHQVDGRWHITPENLAHYLAARAAA